MPTIQHILGVTMFIRLSWCVGVAGIGQTFLMLFVCCLCVGSFDALSLETNYAISDILDMHQCKRCSNQRRNSEWWCILHDQSEFGQRIRKCSWDSILPRKYSGNCDVLSWWCRNTITLYLPVVDHRRTRSPYRHWSVWDDVTQLATLCHNSNHHRILHSRYGSSLRATAGTCLIGLCNLLNSCLLRRRTTKNTQSGCWSKVDKTRLMSNHISL